LKRGIQIDEILLSDIEALELLRTTDLKRIFLALLLYQPTVAILLSSPGSD